MQSSVSKRKSVIDSVLAKSFHQKATCGSGTNLSTVSDDIPSNVNRTVVQQVEGRCTEVVTNHEVSTGTILDESHSTTLPATQPIDEISDTETFRGTCKRRRKLSASDRQAALNAKKVARVAKHAVKPGCGPDCKQKCSMNVDDDKRQRINQELWSMSHHEQRCFMLHIVIMFGDCQVNFVLVSGSKTVDEGCVMPYLIREGITCQRTVAFVHYLMKCLFVSTGCEKFKKCLFRAFTVL